MAAFCVAHAWSSVVANPRSVATSSVASMRRWYLAISNWAERFKVRGSIVVRGPPLFEGGGVQEIGPGLYCLGG